jgi:glucan-binding YG repeat protein
VLHGWWKINDKWYYFNEQHDGTFGAMLTNTVTPDGLHVGPDGAWLGY